MEQERRGPLNSFEIVLQLIKIRMIFDEKQKSQPIEKRQVWEAFKKVGSNKGASGVDKFLLQMCPLDL